METSFQRGQVMQPIDREGVFRGVISSYGLKEMDSGAVAVAVKVNLTQMWTGNEWCDWSQYEMEAEGDVWIVKKTGHVNEGAAQSLINFAGWDGNLLSIVNESWEPKPAAFVIKREEYEGKTRFKVSFVNDYERTPGGLSNVTPEKVKELNTRFGSQFRALAGNKGRNAAPTNGRPTPPPVHSTPNAPPPSDNDIPF